MNETTCSECGFNFEPEESRIPCPDCGSTSRTISVSVSESVRLFDGLGFRINDPGRTGKAKVRAEAFRKYVRSKVSGRLVKHERDINRVADKYFELVQDVETGEIVREADEPLSQHKGHGSAKFRKGSSTGR